MTLTLGFSPCPNDCFMFDAMVHRPDRSRGTRLRRAHGRHRSAELRRVCRRRRHHETELPRLRLLRGRLRAAGCRQRARAELRTTADFAATDLTGRGRGRRPAHRDPGQVHDRELPPEPRVSAGDRQVGVSVLRHRSRRARWQIRCGSDHSREPLHLRGRRD